MSAEPHEAPVIPEWSTGDRLRKVRRLVDQSQAEFAAALGQNQKTYAAWELDTSVPRNLVAIAKRIEAMTGVPAAWVLGVQGTTGATNHWCSPRIGA